MTHYAIANVAIGAIRTGECERDLLEWQMSTDGARDEIVVATDAPYAVDRLYFDANDGQIKRHSDQQPVAVAPLRLRDIKVAVAALLFRRVDPERVKAIGADLRSAQSFDDLNFTLAQYGVVLTPAETVAADAALDTWEGL